MLGLEAASLPFIRQHLDVLPTCRQFIVNERIVVTESPARILATSGLVSFASARPPGEHGHYFPMQWDAEHMRCRRVDKDWISMEAFWQRLAMRGVKVVAFDVDDMSMVGEGPAVEISGWSAQSTGNVRANNKQLLSALQRRFGTRPIGREVMVKKSRAQLSKLRDQTVSAARTKMDALLWLLEETDWQLFLCGLHEVHRGGHNLWPFSSAHATAPPANALLEVYQEFDRQLGRLLESVDLSNTAVVIYVLDGMAANRSQAHFVFSMLERINAKFDGMPTSPKGSADKPGILRFLRRAVPAQVQFAIARMVSETVQDFVVNREFNGGRDWRTTPAFSVPSNGEGTIRLNIKGREAQGCLPADPAGRQPYIDHLTHGIRSFRVVGTDEPLVAEIHNISKLFPGSMSNHLPDLSISWAPREPVCEIYSPEYGAIRSSLQTGRPGNHTGDSFALFAGAVTAQEIGSLKDVYGYESLVEAILQHDQQT